MSVAGAAAAVATIAAIQASGVIVHVEPDDFVVILKRQPGALVVHATGGFDWLPARPTGAKRIKNEPLRSALTNM